MGSRLEGGELFHCLYVCVTRCTPLSCGMGAMGKVAGLSRDV